MSELNSIYFVENEYTMSDFADIYLNNESIREKVDKVIVIRIDEDEYIIKGYKDDKQVELLPNGVYARTVGYSNSYFPTEHGRLIYEIKY
jgi:hypothetical protein